MKTLKLVEITEQLHRLVKSQCSKENVELLFQIDPQVMIKADVQKMMQVFLNLTLNAVQAMPVNSKQRGRVVLCSEVDEASELVRISIADNGQGISRENLENLFTPFFTTKERGTGLGLSIVHKIIEEHEGTIQVESEVGKGTVFYIELPLVKAKQTVQVGQAASLA